MYVQMDVTFLFLNIFVNGLKILKACREMRSKMVLFIEIDQLVVEISYSKVNIPIGIF